MLVFDFVTHAVMVSTYEPFPAVQLRKPVIVITETHIADNDDIIFLSYVFVPIGDNKIIHFLNVWKRTTESAMPKYPGMAQVRISSYKPMF